jgi:hypothetical protein
MGRLLRYVLVLSVAGSVLGASASPLGRLFTTSQERDELDALRRSPSYQTPVDTGDAMPFVEDFTLDGVVVRSSGNNASWINGSSIFEGEVSREGVRVETATGGGALRVRLLRGRDAIQLKPGQTIDVTTRSVLEEFQIKVQQEAESGVSGSTKR